MMVVLPHPLAPTIMVRGKQKDMTCSSSSGEKARTPRIDSLLIDAIFLFRRVVPSYCTAGTLLTTTTEPSNDQTRLSLSLFTY
mmetsp:Transcript_11895/g.24605  ORF Transcript_11895/g.24605 Transcript_11895/m.24605 type:complete len:83 (+) Transcript_11895:1121-1369(+)